MAYSRKIGLLYDFFSCKVINKYLVTILVSPNNMTSYCGHFFPEMWNVAANMYLATIMFTKMHEMKVVALPYKTLQIQGDPYRNLLFQIAIFLKLGIISFSEHQTQFGFRNAYSNLILIWVTMYVKHQLCGLFEDLDSYSNTVES